MENNFLLPIEEYKQSLSPLTHWLEQTAFYASRMTRKPYDRCFNHLKTKLQSGELHFEDPNVVFFERAENGDRSKNMVPLSQYVKATLSNNEIIAPTFTTYLNPEIRSSRIVDLLDENVILRSKHKKLSQKFESVGNTSLYRYNDRLQDAFKRQNNSVSGGFVAEGSVINNKSAHSTLTSTTRYISSLSNASNERLIEGNRQYYSAQIALNNLISIASTTDYEETTKAMEAFDLHYPDIEETLECVYRSTDLYMVRDKKEIALLAEFIAVMTPVERAAFVYTGDLYHLRKHNETFVRTLISELATTGNETPVEDPIGRIRKTDEQFVNYAHQANLSMLRGKGKDYSLLSEKEQYILANTCINIEQVVSKYKQLFKAFFLTRNSPCTIATVPSMIRRTVVLSDTDSTMFSVDNWVNWYFGRLDFSDRGFAIAGAVMFIATQSVAHILALFSANMNVSKKRLFTLAMKPEYVFPVFCQTSVAKHYYTAIAVKEGNVYPKIKMEIKGVHMKDSTVPTNIIKSAAETMESIITTIMRGEKVRLQEVIYKTIAIEQDIIQSINKGEGRYLRRFKIKEASAYKNEAMKSPYQYYDLWEKVFADKYGHAPNPPYNAVRLPLELPNRTALAEWLASIEDRELAERLKTWFVTNEKVNITSFPAPVENCKSHGIPKELQMIVNSRKMALTLTNSYRNILESLGYFTKTDYLVSEEATCVLTNATSSGVIQV